MTLGSKTQKTIRQHGLLRGGEHLLVAVSGGADSVALLHVLRALRKSYKLKLSAIHVHHGLRGHSADEDARFVGCMARRLRVDFLEGRADVKALARRRGISLEMAAREARYTFFRKSARTLAGDRDVVLCTAHTADDQAETLLLKLARGAGSTGLSAIARTRSIEGMKTIRPFLDVSREEITRYLQQHDINWREDESNQDDAFLRNRVRHEILPLLRDRLNPKVNSALTRAADILREEDCWMDGLAATLFRECCSSPDPDNPERSLQVARLSAYAPAARRRVLRHWLQSFGLDSNPGAFQVIDEMDRLVMAGRGSGSVQVGRAHDAVRSYGTLSMIERKTPSREGLLFRQRIRLSGETLIETPGLRVMASAGSQIVKPRASRPGAMPSRATLSQDAIGRKAIIVRSWKPGDRMKPFGLRGSMKLQDIFVNTKTPRDERSEIPIFVCGEEIIWVPGYRIARGWEIKANTRRILELTIERI